MKEFKSKTPFNKNVLIVTGSMSHFVAAATLLKLEGIDVRFGLVSDCVASIEAGNAPDLVISELAAHDIDGPQLCRRVRRMSGKTPVVLVGDISRQSSIVADAFACGASEYVKKPVSPARLLQICQTLLNAESSAAHPQFCGVRMPSQPRISSKDHWQEFPKWLYPRSRTYFS